MNYTQYCTLRSCTGNYNVYTCAYCIYTYVHTMYTYGNRFAYNMMCHIYVLIMHIHVHMLYAGAHSVQRMREHVTPIVPLLTITTYIKQHGGIMY